MSSKTNKLEVPLSDLDVLLQKVLTAASRDLVKAEADLAVVQQRRDVLADRVRRLQLALGEDEVPAGLTGPSHTQEEEPAPSEPVVEPVAQQPPSAYGKLWRDVQQVLGDRQRAIRTSSIISRLVELGYADTPVTHQKVHKSLSRWVQSGRVERRGRGLFRLPASSIAEASTAAGPTEQGTNPAEPTDEGVTALREIDTQSLWALIKQLAKNGPVGGIDLMNTLAADGWSVGTEKERMSVYNRLGAWAKKGVLVRLERGVYALPE